MTRPLPFILFLLSGFLPGHLCFGQNLLCPTGKEGNIWFFGGTNFGAPIGLDFNVGTPPPFLPGCAMITYEASTTVSDPDGNLLFYSNGKKIWNRNHQVMSGGNFLKGHESSTQMLALPKPGSGNLYYLFYPEALETVPLSEDTIRKIYYSVVDMEMEGGLGAVVLEDALLHIKTTEKVTAARHCNGQDWWVLTHESGSNRFFAWLLDSSGLASLPVTSAAGIGNSGIEGTKLGALKFSPNGQKIAMAEAAQASLGPSPTWDAHIELFDFNNSTGEVSNPILLADSLRRAYGVEFSLDNRKVYYGIWNPSDSVVQFDLKVWHPDSIRQSRTVIGDPSPAGGPGMALGPDGKIYLAAAFNNRLDVIHKPNEKGLACQYENEALIFPDTVLSGLGMPNFPASYYAPGKPYIEGPCRACAGEAQRYYVVGNCAAIDYIWEAPGGEIVQQVGDSVWVQFNVPGMQQVTVHRMTPCATWSDTLRVQVEGGLSATDTLYICPGDSVEVFGQWVGQAGSYSQSYSSATGCDSTVTAIVVPLPGGDVTLLSTTSCNPADVGTFVQTLTNQSGCDSTVITTVVFSASDTTLLSSTTCDPGAAGVFTSFFSNQYGCDSTVVETVSLLPVDSVLISSATCDPAGAGVFTSVFSNQYGCDSTVVETVSLLPVDSVLVSSATCDPAGAGVFTSVFSNQYGCDSTVVETVSLLPVDSVFISSATCDPAGAGIFTSVFSNQYGCDSTVVETVSLLPVDSVFISSATCDPAGAGVFTSVFSNQHGCDSIVTEAVSLLPSDTVFLFFTTCDPGQAGTFAQGLTNQHGCDSTLITTVSLLPADTTYQYALTCDPAGAGEQAHHFIGADGCDSTVVVVTGLAEPPTLDLGGDRHIHAGGTAVLAAVVVLPYGPLTDIAWQPPVCGACLAPEVAPDATTAYSLLITDANGCTASDGVTVFVGRPRQVFVPNAFSPNGDGINDRLTVFGKEDARVRLFRIFDRWGEMVFEAADFPANDLGAGWDGRFKGSPLNGGVFAWFAQVVFPDGEEALFKGGTVLVR